MKTTILFSISILIMLSFTSCKKVEGPGGSSSIKGKIHGMRYDGAGNLLNEYDVAKHDVYLFMATTQRKPISMMILKQVMMALLSLTT